VDKFPTPIPAPGAHARNHSSTSSDIHLYADWRTAGTRSPIQFLDCEGFEGSDLPTSIIAKARSAINALTKLRQRYVENAYPRFVYAFSTCVVFVTSGPLAEATKIGERLLDYASQGAGGSQNQGFKPSLFIVFNRFRGGDEPDFDWSVSSSTDAFLAHGRLSDLKLYYGSIYVVYIPSVSKDESFRALSQLDAFRKLLHHEHKMAFRRRQEFCLAFAPDKLMSYMSRALDLFSRSNTSVFNWSLETVHQGFGSEELPERFREFWAKCSTHHARSGMPAQSLYRHTYHTFNKHIQFCLQLALSRKPIYGERVGTIPNSLDGLISHIDRLLLEHAPCRALGPGGITCEELRRSHIDHHQGSLWKRTVRWSGCYEAADSQSFNTFREAFQGTLQRVGERKIFLHDFGKRSYTADRRQINSDSKVEASEMFPSSIRSVTSCLGCLQGPPNTNLACGHAFCHECIFDLGKAPGQLELHRLHRVKCPFHGTLQAFSPRLLPAWSGYRILSLDGGGVKGLAQLLVLREIQKHCFAIPVVELFDLIVGTSIGGQIALALAVPTQSTPLVVEDATSKFRELLSTAFVIPVLSRIPFIRLIFGMATYDTQHIEAELKRLFGEEGRLSSVATSSQSRGAPNVAVTTVMHDTFQAHLITN
jgi:hypothetical protein